MRLFICLNTVFPRKDVAATIYFSSIAMRRVFECGYYYDVAATIYFSSIAMQRLFEGGYYSKYRRRGYYLFQLYHNAATIRGRLLLRRCGYYLFQLYRNAATIRGRLLFKVQTSRLLFISALPQCSDYSRAATIRSTCIYRHRSYYLFQHYNYTAIRRLFEGGYYSKYRRRGNYLFQLYRNAATIRGRLLFEVQTPRLLFISALPQCGDYSRAATIRNTDFAATIYFSTTTMRRLFEGGYYSRCGVYSRKYGIYIIYIYIYIYTLNPIFRSTFSRKFHRWFNNDKIVKIIYYMLRVLSLLAKLMDVKFWWVSK